MLDPMSWTMCHFGTHDVANLRSMSISHAAGEPALAAVGGRADVSTVINHLIPGSAQCNSSLIISLKFR
jgi:hypothetical protein